MAEQDPSTKSGVVPPTTDTGAGLNLNIDILGPTPACAFHSGMGRRRSDEFTPKPQAEEAKPADAPIA